MVRSTSERVLLIGDPDRALHATLLRAAPGAQVTSVSSVFDGIAELSAGSYTTVIAAAEPIEHRPEAAVRTLRDLGGEGARIVLFGDAGHEVLSRRMLEHGLDDYLVVPADAGELRQMLGTPPMRLAPPPPPPPPDGDDADAPAANAPAANAPAANAPADGGPRPGGSPALSLARIPWADVLLDALLNQPHNPLAVALRQVNTYLAPAMELGHVRAGEPVPVSRPGYRVLSEEILVGGNPEGTIYLFVRDDADDESAREALTHVAGLVGKAAALQDRHTRLQRLAITDELTGVYNARYFRHFLARILERARKMHFPVTLLLFDIDDFKKYNDQFGHGVGDEILKQTAALMRRCTREHDLVARIGGDEFAVVFWDKEGPRQPREPRPGHISRPPQSPEQIFQRFKALLAGDEFTALGQSGKGVLGVSAGLAVYPYDAHDANGLIAEADRALMHGAKRRRGKNSLFIVGTDDPTFPPAEAKP